MRMESLVSISVFLLVLTLGAICSAEDKTAPLLSSPPVPTDTSKTTAPANPLTGALQLPDLSKRETFSSAMQIIVLLTVLSLAPAILIMMTSFTRIIIVLSLLRQAMGTQQLPPNQILIGLALFMTFLVMRPTWQRVNDEALRPYLDGKIEQPNRSCQRPGSAARIHDRSDPKEQ